MVLLRNAIEFSYHGDKKAPSSNIPQNVLTEPLQFI